MYMCTEETNLGSASNRHARAARDVNSNELCGDDWTIYGREMTTSGSVSNKKRSLGRTMWSRDRNSATDGRTQNGSSQNPSCASCLQRPSPHTYCMHHARRGECHVFKNSRFDRETGLDVRVGAFNEERRCRETFTGLGFDVVVHRELTAGEMQDVMKQVGAADHTDSDSVVIIVLSHGSEGGVVYGRDGALALDTLVTPLKGRACPSLVGKPKLFFIQACRGTLFDEGALVPSDNPRGETLRSNDILWGEALLGGDELDSAQHAALDVTDVEDFLFGFSTVDGYFSWKSAEGSYYIKALCEALDLHTRELDLQARALDLVSILTRVGHTIATEFESRLRSQPEGDRKKQMPSVLSSLTKDLYLTVRL